MDGCSSAIQLEAAQAGMLELINQGLTQTAFLEALLAHVSYYNIKTASEPYTGADTCWAVWPESLGRGG